MFEFRNLNTTAHDISFIFILWNTKWFESLACRCYFIGHILWEISQKCCRGVGSIGDCFQKQIPKSMPGRKKRWILMDIFRKTCLGTYQKITCEPNISWLEACRSKRPLNSYRPEQSLRRLSSNHFSFA